MKTLLSSLLVLGLSVASFSGAEAKNLPNFKISGTDGKSYSNSTLFAKPTVFVFLKSGCPHSKKSIPDLNRLASMMSKTVNFVGVTDLPLAKANQFRKEIGANFLLLADKENVLQKSTGAQFSLDMVLIGTKTKQIAKTWTGYSRTTITELLQSLPAAGGPAIKADLSKFPSGTQSGCGY